MALAALKDSLSRFKSSALPTAGPQLDSWPDTGMEAGQGLAVLHSILGSWHDRSINAEMQQQHGDVSPGLSY